MSATSSGIGRPRPQATSTVKTPTYPAGPTKCRRKSKSPWVRRSSQVVRTSETTVRRIPASTMSPTLAFRLTFRDLPEEELAQRHARVLQALAKVGGEREHQLEAGLRLLLLQLAEGRHAQL